MQLVVEEQFTAAAAVVPKSTVVSPPVENPLPVIVITVPSFAAPEFGTIPVTVGGEGEPEGGVEGGAGGAAGGGVLAVHWA